MNQLRNNEGKKERVNETNEERSWISVNNWIMKKKEIKKEKWRSWENLKEKKWWNWIKSKKKVRKKKKWRSWINIRKRKLIKKKKERTNASLRLEKEKEKKKMKKIGKYESMEK